MELSYYTILITKGNMEKSAKSLVIVYDHLSKKLNKLWKDDGRAFNDLLRFFDTYLKFEETKLKITQDLNKVENK
jgi:hypothetical protein